MKKLLIPSLLLVLASCVKTEPSPGPGDSPYALWPIQPGNRWIYQDSTFNGPSAFSGTYPDTVTITSSSVEAGGLMYYGVSDPYGWFGANGYVAVDPYNTTILEMDDVNDYPYVFFALVPSDGYLIGTDQDFSNPTCVVTYSQYGQAWPVTVGAYSCYENVGYSVDCSGVTREVIVYYVSEGVGVVRIEDYVTDGTGALYLDYSQTLRSYNL
ncbi:MAG TPA: hypothetical protein VL547_00545 [Dinghuibacter sp.]|jgi:hypothetical protein|uniref:hypothetical protein n=1 Tax=Dinghuibacter sp. TaxID=2024697 RepID=UPI002CF3F470|nr:hypothetical protein [Dinghuibacter sp.]HTJ10476.1 hypothetical protein [Dinghuibacter sp.]